jgi:hypothetical protein
MDAVGVTTLVPLSMTNVATSVCAEAGATFTGAGLKTSPVLAPVPVSGTVCGLPVALSATLMLAESRPTALGSNATEILQDAPAASVFPHGLVALVLRTKAAALVPVIVIPDRLSVPPPLFVSCTTVGVLVLPWIWLPKPTEVGLKVTAGVAVMPVPLIVATVPKEMFVLR